MLETAVAEISPEATASSNGEGVWIEALPARVYTTPQYGSIPVAQEKLERMIANFNDNVRGIEIATDFEHGRDTAKGLQASGWYREFKVDKSSDDPEQVSLWARVEFTDDAKQEIADKKWKYWSLEWDDEYVDDKGEMVPDVILGGGLTNRPVAKRTMPINFSEAMWEELDDDTKREFAVWSTAFVNNLPDSAFLYVESGGKKDGDGKTVPRGLRHLPYKGSDGKIDLPHLRNAIARIPQMKGISDSLKASLQARARKLLGGSQKAASEQSGTAVQEAYELLVQNGFDVLDESKEWEHSEPGTGPTPQIGSPEQPDPGTGQPVPRVQGDPAKENKDIGGGWRRDPLPSPPNPPDKPINQVTTPTEGGENVTLEEELAQLLSVPPDKIKETVSTIFSEHQELRNAVNASSEEKKFAETYPSYWREHQELLERDRKSRATTFSESVSRVTKPEGDSFIPTGQGLSALVMEKIAETHVKFAEGKATIVDFEETISAITKGGLVDYGEHGSSRGAEVHQIDTTTATGVRDARKLFAEKIAEVQKEEPELSYMDAVKKAADKYPDIAEGYRVAPVAAVTN